MHAAVRAGTVAGLLTSPRWRGTRSRSPSPAAWAQTKWCTADLYASTARITGARLYKGMFGNRTLLGGFDVIYDCVGSARTLHDSLRCARAGGAVVIVGLKLRPLKVDLSPIWNQEVDLTGTASHGHDTWQGNEWDNYDLIVDFLRAGKLTSDGFITHRFPLARWRDAVRTATDKTTGSIKVVIDHRLG